MVLFVIVFHFLMLFIDRKYRFHRPPLNDVGREVVNNFITLGKSFGLIFWEGLGFILEEAVAGGPRARTLIPRYPSKPLWASMPQSTVDRAHLRVLGLLHTEVIPSERKGSLRF